MPEFVYLDFCGCELKDSEITQPSDSVLSCLSLKICRSTSASDLQVTVISQAQIREELSSFAIFTSTQLSIVLYSLYFGSRECKTTLISKEVCLGEEREEEEEECND